MADQIDRSGWPTPLEPTPKRPMSRRQAIRALAFGGLGGILAACGGAATVPEAPQAQPTLAVAQPAPGGLATAPPAPPAPPAPTAPPAATAAPAATTAPAAGADQFVLNGVTLPYKRSETLVADQVPYTIFDSFNIYIPNGHDFASGYRQNAVVYLWYANYVTGEI